VSKICQEGLYFTPNVSVREELEYYRLVLNILCVTQFVHHQLLCFKLYYAKN